MKARVMPNGELALPVDLLDRHGLVHGVEIVVEELEDAIVLRMLDNVVARAQALSQELLRGKGQACVEDFLADRVTEAERE